MDYAEQCCTSVFDAEAESLPAEKTPLVVQNLVVPED